jgi:hypothetical protein
MKTRLNLYFWISLITRPISFGRPLNSETKKKIFNKIVKELEKFTPPMIHKKDSAQGYELIGDKPVPYGSKRVIIPGMSFASAMIRTDSVAFYFFPCYMDPSMEKVAPSVFKHAKGKTCFHFKKVEDVNEKELAALLKAGSIAWKKAGYLK